jgi:DNA invertase Pin-like site-specific DNA recombinase
MKKTQQMAPHLIGYARVSTDEQNLDLQIDALMAAGAAPGDVWTDKETGQHADRPGLQGALKAVRPGDVLIVWKLDRLGRSVLDILNIVRELREKGASFRSLTQAIDTSGPMGNLIVTVLGAVAELESSLISERTKAGMTAAKRKGKHVGRPKN